MLDKDKKSQFELKHKIEVFNKLLLTINEDLLDKFVFKTYENALARHRNVFKVIDFAPEATAPGSGQFVLKL